MYKFDETAARKADNGGGKITQFGDYKGHFTRVENITSSKGTKGVEFAFEDESESYATFTLWTKGADGKTLSGFNKLCAIMKILRVPELTPVDSKIEKYDFDTKKNEIVTASVFKDLMLKPIGVLFNTVEEGYTKKLTGEFKLVTKLDPAAFYRTDDRMTVSEILDKATAATEADKIAEKLTHKPYQGDGAQRSSGSSSVPSDYTPSDDDIPFD